MNPSFKAALVLAMTVQGGALWAEEPKILNASTHSRNQPLRSYVIRVQPIVTRNDEGKEPASMALPMDLVEQAYAPADVSVVFFEPIFVDNKKARDGEINLDMIVDLAQKGGYIKGAGDVINLIFVSAVDGKRGPLGRGMQGGNITFIALGEEGGKNRAMQGFVIAHEIAHNLNLPHAKDDPNVVEKSPNLLGEGPFEERIGPKSLTPSQVEIIRKSPFVRPRVDLLTGKEAEEQLLDETYDPFISQLNHREVAAFTGATVASGSPEKTIAEARQRFSQAVLDFSPSEKEAIVGIVGIINESLIAQGMNKLARYPWRFIKTSNALCGGMSYTRGTSIVLSERTIESITKNYQEALSTQDSTKNIRSQGLFLHEQFHILERTFPERFAQLFQNEWGFVRAKVKSDVSIEKSKVTNPDAPRAEWLIPDKRRKDHYSWIRVEFGTENDVPKMGTDFVEKVYSVEMRKGIFEIKKDRRNSPVSTPLKDLSLFAARFPVKTGLDHPNEIVSYMFADFYREVVLGQPLREPRTDEQNRVTEKFRQWCRDQFK